MTITVGGSSITFPDSTTQTTAAGVSLPGVLGQVFTSSGTFTIPSGVTAVKVIVTGGGGGGSGSAYAGGGMQNGSNSSVSSGTQTIGTITGTGGIKAGSGATAVGTGGDFNLYGGSNVSYYGGASYFQVQYTNAGVGVYGSGGASFGGCSSQGGNGGATAIKYLTGLTPGATLTVTIGNGGAGGSPDGNNGGKGVALFEW